MNMVKVAKITRIILLVVACITFMVGVVVANGTNQEAKHDVSKVAIQITDKEVSAPDNSSYDSNAYRVDLTYEITNSTKVTWIYLDVVTSVYDSSGNMVGTISSTFGDTSNYSDLKVKPGETVEKISSFESYSPDEIFTLLYETDLSDLSFEYHVENGTYQE